MRLYKVRAPVIQLIDYFKLCTRLTVGHANPTRGPEPRVEKSDERSVDTRVFPTRV
ncbi:hypothetical protein PSEMO_30500 [Pseudomonas putida]|uniref:Uncharacterized protein n=1 Tax=Pseudomonas putida TaxID=303 RepID=A0A1Q9R416_PSEPU|nr:hypothetical protein PSEMO_30500 [Pseudomonas putida]